jgi:hypothetical protein
MLKVPNIIYIVNFLSVRCFDACLKFHTLLSYDIFVVLFQAAAGLAADGRQIVSRAKSEAASYEK